MKLFSRKNSHVKALTDMSKDSFHIEPPSVAYGGDYFRSLAFYSVSSEEHLFWCEAIEHPLTNRWKIQEILTLPNNDKEKKSVEGAESLSFFDAVKHMVKFEKNSGDGCFQYIPIENDGVKESNEYYKNFAEAEGIAFDVNGKPNFTLHGRIVSDGIFSAEAEAKAMQAYKNPPTPNNDNKDKNRLSHIFQSTAGHVTEDFDRLLDINHDRAKWADLYNALDDIVKLFDTCQNNSWYSASSKIIPKESPLPMARTIKKITEISTSILSPQKEELKNIEHFLGEVLMTYQIACARYLFLKIDKADTDQTDNINKLKTVKKYIAKCCRALGGSDRDIQAINSEIIKDKQNITDEPNTNSLNGKRIKSPRGEWVYYAPEALYKFPERYKDMAEKFDGQIEREKQRITRQPSSPSQG